MSQAQQLAWIKEHRPEVCARVKKAVADGRFVPAGGMWVESDTNMPGSEAMARQFVHGKRFFLDEFGVENDEVWLPDTFGFAAGLPQIIKAAGSKWLLTQKISWSPDQQVPAPHLPVGGHRRHPDLHPLPARRHLQLLHAGQRDRPRGDATSRTRASPGTPSRPPAGATEAAAPPARWSPRRPGCATSKAPPPWRWETPDGVLRQGRGRVPEPARLGRRALPGAAPRHPHQPGQDQAGQPAQRAPAARGRAVGGHRRRARPDSPTRTRSWTGSGRRCCCTSSTTSCPARRSPGCTARPERPTRRVAEELNGDHRRGAARAGRRRATAPLVFNAAPHARARRPGGRRRGRPAVGGGADAQCRARRAAATSSTTACCGSRSTRAAWSSPRTTSAADRETVAPGAAANLLQLHPDFPNMWDAWDVDEFYRNTVTDLTDADEVDRRSTDAGVGADRPRLRRLDGHPGADPRAAGAKRLDIDTEVDWHETEKFLKLAFPLDVHAERYAVGDPVRPLLPAHPHQHQLGGGQVRGLQPPLRARGGARLGRRAGQRLDVRPRRDPRRSASRRAARPPRCGVSLLRAPRFPDPETDQGVHRFRHALVPGAAIGDAVREGYCDQPAGARGRPATAEVAPLVHGGQRRGRGHRGQAGRRRQRRRGRPLPRVARRPRQGHPDAGFPLSAAVTADLLERPLADPYARRRAGVPAAAARSSSSP